MGYALIIIAIIAPLALVALAVTVDIRMRRGYGLGALAAGALLLDVWGLATSFHAAQVVGAAQTDTSNVALTLAAYLLIGLYLALALALGAIVETLIARQWRWLALIVAASVLPPALSLVAGTALAANVFGAVGLPGGSELVLFQLLPVLAILAYALARSARR